MGNFLYETGPILLVLIFADSNGVGSNGIKGFGQLVLVKISSVGKIEGVTAEYAHFHKY